MTYSLMSLPEFNKYAFQWSTEFAARCEVGESRGTPVEGVEAVAFQTAADELLHHAAEVRDTLPDSPIGVELLRKVEALEAAALALRDAAICGAWRWLAEAGIAAFHRARLALRRCKLPATREPAEIVGLDGEVEKPTDVSVYVSAKELLAIYRGELDRELDFDDLTTLCQKHAIRWTRFDAATGKPKSQRRWIHYGDWRSHLRAHATAPADGPDPTPTDIARRKAEVRAARK